MEKFKGTPGPWFRVSLLTNSKLAIKSASKTFPIANAMVIDLSRHENKFAPDSEAEANANLIAAAPDLLEVIQIALEMLNKGVNISTHMALHENIKAAVAKALGNEPAPR